MTRMRHVTQEPENADSLLASIRQEEDRQEIRVQKELASQQEEEQAAMRRFAEEEARKEDVWRNGAQEELRIYADTEPKAVLEEAAVRAKADAAAFKANARKNAKKVAADLLEKLLALSFLSRP